MQLKYYTLLIIVLQLGKLSYSQNHNINTNSISLLSIKTTIDTLTSDYYQGRGIESSDKVIEFISNYFDELGLQTSYDNAYRQEIRPFSYLQYSDSSYVFINNSKLNIQEDFTHSLFDYKEKYNHTRSEITADVFFIGLANQNIDSVLAQENLKNKAVILFPNGIKTNDILNKKGVVAVIEPFFEEESYEKMKMYEPIFYKSLKQINVYLEEPNTSTFAKIYLSPKGSEELLGIKISKLKTYSKKYNQINDSIRYNIPKQIRFYIHREKKFYASGNVIGYIQGKDTTGEHIILSAHYDHLGKTDSVYFPGANDNASGLSSMLEIARVLSEMNKSGIKPEKSIVFIAFGLEESKILGSTYYVDNPLLPLEKLKANINLDMIGRQDKYHDSIPNYIYALGPDSLSLDIKELMDSINSVYNFTNLEYLYEYPDVNMFLSQSSDQFQFLKKNVPAVLINNGMHKDLHRSTDTKDKLNYNTIENVSKLVLLTVWELAN